MNAMNKKKYWLFILTFVEILTFSSAFGKTQLLISQYMLNTMQYNPGFAGFSGSLCLSGLHRQQGMGFKVTDKDGKTNLMTRLSLVTAEMPIEFLKGGVGLTVQSSKWGYASDTRVGLAYAYHLETSVGRLGLGLQLDLRDISVDFAKLDPEQANDPTLNSKQKENGFFTDFSVGAYFNSYANFFAGVAFNNIIAGHKDVLSYKTARELSINGGYNFSFDNLPDIEFTPTTILRTDFSSVAWNVTALATFRKKIWGGIGYTVGDAVTILAGINILQFRVGVSYDINASNMIKGSPGGSLEIYLKYCFELNADKVNTNYKNSRYL